MTRREWAKRLLGGAAAIAGASLVPAGDTKALTVAEVRERDALPLMSGAFIPHWEHDYVREAYLLPDGTWVPAEDLKARNRG